MELQKAIDQDLELLVTIAYRAKCHWDYPQDFLDKCRVYFKEEFTPEYLEKSHTCLIKQDDTVIGMGTLLWEDEPMLDQFWFLPEYIGKGLGRKAFELFVVEAKKRDWPSLTIISDVYAEGFYKTMGAKRVGELKSAVRDAMLPKMLLTLK